MVISYLTNSPHWNFGRFKEKVGGSRSKSNTSHIWDKILDASCKIKTDTPAETIIYGRARKAVSYPSPLAFLNYPFEFPAALGYRAGLFCLPYISLDPHCTERPRCGSCRAIHLEPPPLGDVLSHRNDLPYPFLSYWSGERCANCLLME